MNNTGTKEATALSVSSLASVFILACGPAASAPPISAGISDSTLIEEVVAVETRLDEGRFSIGEEVSVSSTDLTTVNPVDPEHLFQMLSGFSVSRPGGPGGVSEVFLRGAESNFTAVHVDGVRLNNPSNTRGGSFDFSSLGIFDIGRVDVSAGAMSAVYGADAMAGVVLIRSAWAEPGSPSAFLEAGSVDNWRVGAQASFGLGNDMEWGVRASSTDGGNEIDGSSLRLDSLGTRLVGSFSDGDSWEVNLRQVTRDRASFPEVSGGPELAVNRALETADGDSLTLAAEGRWTVTDDWNSDVYLNFSRITDDSLVPAVAPGLLDGQPAFSTITNYERSQFLWVNRLDLDTDLSLVTGVDLVSEDGSDDGAVDLGFALAPNSYELDRSTTSAFAELGKRWNEKLTTAVAARWDHTGDDGRFSGKFGVSRTVSDSGSRVWARLANGFKLPSFFALGNPLFGNPDLVAEKVRSAEVGYTHELTDTNRIIVSTFKSRYDNLVDFDFESFTNVNRGRIDVSGVEIRGNFQVTPTLRLFVDATLADISSSSGPLRRRPERTGGVRVNWTISEQWNLNVTARYAGSRLITSIPTGDVDASGFTLVGATARYERLPNQSFWLAIDNAFDEDYQDAPGFPSPGARVRFGASLTF
ncbi:MAG: TonB-dependent receptor [Gammaproteobacteria bacterium]|nr:TonB-dependent receptor [Gammaproteobacteria bacterium]